MYFFTEVPFNTEVFIALELGIITIFTIFFSFAGIKSNLQSEFKDNIDSLREQYKTKIAKSNLDYLISKLNQKYYYLGKCLTISGQTFRICIYLGILAIIILGIHSYLELVVFYHFFLAILLLQLLGLYQNVHRFKEFYELDLEREFHKEKEYLELIQSAFNIKDYDSIGEFKKKEKGVFKRLISDIKSIFRFKI
mgnify:CR=1 FL=1